MAGPFVKPGSAAPEVTKSAAEAEAQRQLDYLLDVRMGEQERVRNIADRILRANAGLCPETRPQLGLRATTLESFAVKLRPAAERRWGLGDGIKVMAVASGAAAQVAGVAPGDEIVTLQGEPVASGKKALAAWARQLDAALDKKPETVRLGVRRGGETRELELKPDIVCGYDVVLDSDAPELNAYADGHRIILTRPILKLAATEPELALVISHELAHNARRHMSAQKKNAAVGFLGGALLDVAAAAAGVNTQGAFMKAGQNMGAGMYSPEFEAEADYVGLYFMTRAGFQSDGVENFWRKMGAEDPKGIYTKSSHPPSAERFLAIAAAREEIKAKGGDLASLAPNERGAKAATPAVGGPPATEQALKPAS